MKKTFLSLLPFAALAAALAVSSARSSAADLPAECDSYLKKLEVCLNKASASNSAGTGSARQARQLLESVRQQWSEVTDKAALAQACKQASDETLAQTMKKLGCN